tara:strand:- start:3861 stop:4562 length:702 start_codon:yes stop_codon:yes gene_type:complete
MAEQTQQVQEVKKESKVEPSTKVPEAPTSKIEEKPKTTEAPAKAPVAPTTTDKKDTLTTKEFTIPIKKAGLKVQRYRKTSRAIKTIRKFIARHMKVPDRDLSKIKIDPYFNNDLWFKGKTNPPAKIKVKVTQKDDDFIVNFAETPQHVKFLKLKRSKLHKKAEKKPEPKPEEAPKEQKQEKEQTEEEKKEEKEKAQSAADAKTQQAEAQAKADKHVAKLSKEPKHQQRQALKK